MTEAVVVKVRGRGLNYYAGTLPAENLSDSPKFTKFVTQISNLLRYAVFTHLTLLD